MATGKLGCVSLSVYLNVCVYFSLSELIITVNANWQ